MPLSKQKILILAAILVFFTMGYTERAIADEVEIGNLVINRTVTRVGIDFFNAFSDRWYSLESLGTMHIRVSEVPSARWGSIISVWVGEEIFFRTRLSSRAKNIEAIAEQAVSQIMATVAARSIQSLQNEGKGDLVGDGL